MNPNIKIETELPGPMSEKLNEKRKKYVAGAYGKESFSSAYIAEGNGALVKDVDGNQFIDLTGGWGCLLAGHTPKRVTKAIIDQAQKYLHTDFAAIPYEPYVQLAEKLSKLTIGETTKSVCLFNSGAEAVENVVKIARGYTERDAIVVFENAFHGRTLLTMSMTHKSMPYKYKFGPFATEVYRLPYPSSYRPSIKIEKIEDKLTSLIHPEEIAAVVVEPIQGEGGFQIPKGGFLEKLRELSNNHGMLFAVDEVQSGIGRTGKLFAIEHWGIEPDLIASAKSLAAGLPLSAVIGKRKIMDSLPSSSIGGTYTGNPVACRAALEVLNKIEEENLLEKASKIGKRIRQGLEEMQERFHLIGDVRGIGAMSAVEFVRNRETKQPATEATSKIVKQCKMNGVLLATAGLNHNVIRFLNSLVITDEQIDEALNVLEEVIAEVA